MHKWLDLIEKLALVGVGAGVVFWLMMSFNVWADPLKDLFLKTDNVQGFIIVSLIVFVIGFVMKKLLVWEVDAAFHLKHKNKRKRS